MDLEGFKIKVIPLKNKLYRLAHRLLEDAEEAKDIVQEVFIRLWNMREKLDAYRSVEALAVVTTRNMCLDKLKSKKYHTDKLDNLKTEVEEVMFEERKDLSDIINKINLIIKTLPEQQQTIIQLRDIEGYDFAEIAEILDMNENAVRVSLSRARKKIREILINAKIYEFQRN
ncbi:MAG TPA: sigma-70 family RNA polymerase sigma factor [Bacteroidales bacterium]|nr:sigma-70 family RNA polymerase sigma factor [Bacteroidales bacterium]